MVAITSPSAVPAPKTTLQPVTGTAVHFDISLPLRDMKRIPPPWEARVGEEREVPNRILPKAQAGRTEKRIGTDLAVQSWPGSGPAMPSPIQNWEGVDNVSGVLPPDTNGDVGLNHYMQWVNLTLAIWDKQGHLVYGPVDGNTIWQGFGGPCDACNDGDPVVIYDRYADRWVISQFVIPSNSGPFYQYVAVSTSGDPTGSWYRYAMQIPNKKFGDYPKMGVWTDAYYMTVNQFTNNWAGAGVFALDRAKMLAGDPTASFIYFDLGTVNTGYGGMLPVSAASSLPPPAGSPGLIAEVDDDAWGWPADQFSLWEFHANWSNPSASTLGIGGDPTIVLPTAPFDSNLCGYNLCIPQQGVTSRLDPISDRLMFRLQYMNYGDHQSLVTSHNVDADGTDHAGVRWYELRNSGAGWSIYQQGTYAPDLRHRWMGSVGMDKAGDIAVGYSVSGTDLYPGIRYAGRVPSDPLGTLGQAEQSLIEGSGAQTHSSGRWGDYSSMSLDPSDDCTFWYTQEYYTVTSSASWQTRIGSFKFPGCGGASTVQVTAQAIPPSGVAPLSVTLTASASGGQTPYTYAWDLGDGSTASGSSVTHTYASVGNFGAKVTATDGASKSASTTVYVNATVPPPVIIAVRKLTNPLRLKITGSNFHPGCSVAINGTSVTVSYKSSTSIVAKGSTLKSLLPKGVTVQLVVTNTDDGGISAAFPYTR